MVLIIGGIPFRRSVTRMQEGLAFYDYQRAVDAIKLPGMNCLASKCWHFSSRPADHFPKAFARSRGSAALKVLPHGKPWLLMRRPRAP